MSAIPNATVVLREHRVHITNKPVAGSAIYRGGKLFFIIEGQYKVDGRISNYFTWALIRPDGTLGRKTSGYWNDTQGGIPQTVEDDPHASN